MSVTEKIGVFTHIDDNGNKVELYPHAKKAGVTLTQAEYDALPDTKNSDGIPYWIEDGEGGSGGSGITDTSLSIAGAAADAKAVGDRLTASDNTPFRFGVTEDGKYGYIVTDSEGADTVIPFSEGNADSLYEALQYSGLVTEDMTYEEMLEALSTFFPEIFSLLNDEVSDYTVSRTGNYVTSTFSKTTDGYFQISVKGPDWNGNYHHQYIERKEAIDLTRYSKFIIAGTNSVSSGAGCEVMILNASSKAEIAKQAVAGGGFEHTIDVSSINESCLIKYHGYSSAANAYSTATFTRIDLVS